MYTPRTIRSDPTWQDTQGIKIYTISADGAEVPWDGFLARLAQIKATRPVDWDATPAFVIFHRGASQDYLVLAWWGNDNELFTSVSVTEAGGWVEDPLQYSFCLFDLEVFWAERNLFVRHMYCDTPSLEDYRHGRLSADHHELGRAARSPGPAG